MPAFLAPFLAAPLLVAGFVGTFLVASAAAQDVGVPAVPADGYDRDRGVDVLHYDVAIDLPGEPGPITARARILAERRRDDLEALRLDFGTLGVDSVRVDGAAASWMAGDGAIMVTLPAAPAGAHHEVVIWYRGVPADGLILRANRHGDFAAFGDNWPDRAHHWIPSVDHPGDKATFALTATAPAAWRVVGNGYQVERTELPGGRARTRWRETAEIPTYTMIVGAAPFAVADLGTAAGVAVTGWTFPQDSLAGAAAFARAAEILHVYDSIFGPFPYEKLAHVQSATRYGGMENSSAIFYSENRIGEALAAGAGAPGDARDGLTSLVAHETVHQWFGDAVTEADWHHLWLSEGFASYFAVVFFELRGSSHGAGPAELARGMRNLREEVLAWDREAGLAIVDPGRVAAGGEYVDLLHTGNYEKGAWVLHMLRRAIGDEAFHEAVRAYYAALRDQNAWTADFEQAAEDASGQDLGWFFAQWLSRAGHPVLSVAVEPAGSRTRIVVRQVQEADPWRLAVELALPGGRRAVELTGREGSIEVEGAVSAADVTLDPDAWLLFEPAR